MNGASMNGHADEQPEGLRIPEHLLQEVVTASHVTGTPRSTGLFDYISRSAATILQTRPFSARSNRGKAVNGAAAQVIAPTAHNIAGSGPPDMQDRSNSKYPQVVQPQNSVEACVLGDGGADSVLEGGSVQLGRNREAPRAAKAVTFQDVSRDSVLGEPSSAHRRQEEDRVQEFSFNPPPQPAVAAPKDTQRGQFRFNAEETTTTQNPYSKHRTNRDPNMQLVELCNQRGRRGRRGATVATTTGPTSRLPEPHSVRTAPALAIPGPSTSRRNPFSTNEITRAASNNPLNGDTSLVRFEPTSDPAALARTLPPSATTTYQRAAGAGTSTGAGSRELAPQSSMHLSRSTINNALYPSGGVPSASLPVSKRLSHAPPPASRYALFGPAAMKPSSTAPPATTAINTANALIAAPANSNPNSRMQSSAAAAGWRIPKRDVPAQADLTSTWVPSRARMLARRRAARVRFKPGATAGPSTADPFNGAASQDLVVRSGTKRIRALSPGDVAAMHERSATRRRIDSSVYVARRSLRASDQPQITAGELLDAADAIASRKVAAQQGVPAFGSSRGLLSSQQNPPELLPGIFGPPGGAPLTDMHAQRPSGLGSGITFPDAFGGSLSPSTALIAEQVRREKAMRVRERESGPSSVSPPSKRHAPGGSPLDPPSLAGPSFPHSTPAMLGASASAAGGTSGVSGVTDPPTNLDSSLRFPSAQPVSALIGGSSHSRGHSQAVHAGHAAHAPSNVGPVLDLLERKRQEMTRGDGPSMSIAEVREKLGAQEAAKQAVDEQRKQAARGASPENPQYKAPSDAPSEAQAQPWPAWDRAVKEREVAGLPKFTNISQVMNALPNRGADQAPSSHNTLGTSAAPGGFTPAATSSRPPVPPLFGPGSVSAANAAAGAASFGMPSSSAAAVASASGLDAPQSTMPASGNAGSTDATAGGAEAAAAAPKKKPAASGGWGDAFLQSNAAESAATQKAIQEEVDKANNPAAAAASFGSPVPAATSKGGSSAPAASSSSLNFSFGGQPPSQPPSSTAAAAAPVATTAAAVANNTSAPLFGQQPAATAAPVATSGKRGRRDESEEPATKRSVRFTEPSERAAPLFGTSAPAAPSSTPLFGGVSAAAGSTAAGFSPGLFGQSSAAPSSSDAGVSAPPSSQPLFGAPASAAGGSAPGSAPLFGAPVVSTGAPSAAASTGFSSGAGMPSFTFGGPTAAPSVPAAASSAMPSFGGSSAGAAAERVAAKSFQPIVFTPPSVTTAPVATGYATAVQPQGGDRGTRTFPDESQGTVVATGGQTPMFGTTLFGSSTPNTATPAAVQTTPTFGGSSFGASGFGGASTGFGAPGANSSAAASPAMPSFSAAAGAGAPVTTGAANPGLANPFGTPASASAPSQGAGVGGFGAGSTAGAPPFGGSSLTPNGFSSAASPGGLFGAAAASSSAAIQPLEGSSSMFGASSQPMFGSTTTAAPGAANIVSPAANLFASSSSASTLFGAAPGGAGASTPTMFGAASGSATGAVASGGFSFGGGFGAPPTGGSSQPALGVGAGALPFGYLGQPIPEAPAAGRINHGGGNPFGAPSAGPFGNSSSAAPAAGGFQFGASITTGSAVNPTPSNLLGAGNNSIFGNTSGATPAAGGFAAAAAPSPFGAPAGGTGFGAAPAIGSGFGAPVGGTGFGAPPGQVGSPAFGAQTAAFGAGGGAASPLFGGAQPQPQVAQQQPTAQLGAMFGGNAQAFNMGPPQPNQGRKGRVVVRRRPGRGGR